MKAGEIYKVCETHSEDGYRHGWERFNTLVYLGTEEVGERDKRIAYKFLLDDGTVHLVDKDFLQYFKKIEI